MQQDWAKSKKLHSGSVELIHGVIDGERDNIEFSVESCRRVAQLQNIINRGPQE